MALGLVSSGRAALRSCGSGLSLGVSSRRGLASTSRLFKEASAVSTGNAEREHVPSMDKGKKASSSTPTVPSSCPPGTVLSGLSLYKDRADPVALPDSEYPEWLWSILDDSTTLLSHSGVTLESTAGLSKGEARVVQKRNLRAVRSAQRGQESKQKIAGAGAGMKATGAPSEGLVEPPAGEAEALLGVAAVALEGASEKSIEAENEAKKALRKANREKIKAKNFIAKR